MQELLITIIIISSIPAGMILAYLTRDELKIGKEWFKIIVMCSLSLMFFYIFFAEILEMELENELAGVFSLAYLFSISTICLNYKKSWFNRKV